MDMGILFPFLRHLMAFHARDMQGEHFHWYRPQALPQAVRVILGISCQLLGPGHRRPSSWSQDDNSCRGLALPSGA